MNPITPNQKQVLATVIRATEAGRWTRASDHGERVTLASLYYRSLLVRRAWRGIEGERDAAHEYRAAEQVLVGVQKLRAAANSIPFTSAPDVEVTESSHDCDESSVALAALILAVKGSAS